MSRTFDLCKRADEMRREELAAQAYLNRAAFWAEAEQFSEIVGGLVGESGEAFSLQAVEGALDEMEWEYDAPTADMEGVTRMVIE